LYINILDHRHVAGCCVQKATEVVEQMKQQGVQPNLQTYTTLVHGWASASYPEKALVCYDEMKAAGMKPDKALYHCIMTSLLSRAAVARETVFDGVLRVTSEMVDQGICVDFATAKHWQRFLIKAERQPGDLTSAVEGIFPPGTNHLIPLFLCCYCNIFLEILYLLTPHLYVSQQASPVTYTVAHVFHTHSCVKSLTQFFGNRLESGSRRSTS
jgi:pentatricopeptide repeat protein